MRESTEIYKTRKTGFQIRWWWWQLCEL